MSSLVKNVLIVGGGFSGLAAAIELRKLGIAVEVVEIEPDWLTDGIGISLIGPALRALRTLGVLDDVLAEGHASDGVDLFALDGALLAHLPTPRIAGPNVPGSGAIMRRTLAKILADKAFGLGANVRLGSTFRAMRQNEHAIEVELADGQRRRYDLVIGADGVQSRVRNAVLPKSERPNYCGQGTWRALLPRSPEIERTTLWIGGNLKLGLSPVSETEMYLFINECRSSAAPVPDAQLLPLVKSLLAQLPNQFLQTIGEQLDEHSCVVYRPIESLLMPLPWHQNRVVLIGDAVHASTPHLATGTCMGIEDAIVLAQALSNAACVPEALAAFQQRRWERCRMVIESARQLSEIERQGTDGAEHAPIMDASFARLLEEI